MSSGSTAAAVVSRRRWPLSADGFSAEAQVVGAASLWSLLAHGVTYEPRPSLYLHLAVTELYARTKCKRRCTVTRIFQKNHII